MFPSRTITRAAMLAVILGGCTEGDGPRDGPRPLAEQRGALAEGSSAPALVRLDAGQLRALGAFVRDDVVRCTGALIAPRRVLTAAHCFADEADLGPFDFVPLSGDGQRWRLPLANVAVHPSLDLAAVTLGAELPPALAATPLAVRAAPLGADAVGASIEVAGAGFGTPSGVSFGVFAIEAVEATRVQIGATPPYGLCAGDSGGPFFSASGDVEILAVTSTSAPDCGSPSFGARTDMAAAWLGEVLAGELPAASETCDAIRDTSRCEGDRARSCRAGFWRDNDCSVVQLSCGALAGGGDGCLPAACGTVDRHGLCDGGTARWCGGRGLEAVDCRARGLGCEYSAGDDGFRCVACTTCACDARLCAAEVAPGVASEQALQTPHMNDGCASESRTGSGIGAEAAIVWIAWLQRRRFAV